MSIKNSLRLICDSAARMLLSSKVTGNQDYLDTTTLSGMYWYKIISNDGFSAKGKIIKN